MTRILSALTGLALAGLTQSSFAATDRASTLVMPFDATAGHVSFLAVSHRGGSSDDLRTHWAFWDESCELLLDVSICLPADGGIVIDPTAVVGAGDAGDLSGRRGFATVTAYETPGTCDPTSSASAPLADASLFGTFTLASIDSGAAFGGEAIAVPSDATESFADLPADAGSYQSALHLQSFAPASLDQSRVILLALRERSGVAAYATTELGPAGDDASPVLAAATFADNAGAQLALPDLSFGCALFASLHSGDPDSLLLGSQDLPTGGVLEIDAPRIGDQPLGETTWLFGFHGQALGTFGALAIGQPALGTLLAPTPNPTATRTPAASATPVAPPTSSPSPTAGLPTPTYGTPGPSTPTPTSIVAPTPVASATTATPAPTLVGPTPSSSPVATPTPRPGRTPTPDPGNTPTPLPTATPTPAVASPTPSASPSPSPAVTATPPPDCESFTLQIRTTYSGGEAAGVAATLSYPQAHVAIPGSGNEASVVARVTNVAGVSGLFQVIDRDVSGDATDDNLRIGLVSIGTPIPPGPFARARFDCVSGPVPSPAAFGCALEASTLDGDLLAGASCSVEILS